MKPAVLQPSMTSNARPSMSMNMNMKPGGGRKSMMPQPRFSRAPLGGAGGRRSSILAAAVKSKENVTNNILDGLYANDSGNGSGSGLLGLSEKEIDERVSTGLFLGCVFADLGWKNRYQRLSKRKWRGDFKSMRQNKYRLLLTLHPHTNHLNNSSRSRRSNIVPRHLRFLRLRLEMYHNEAQEKRSQPVCSRPF